MRSSRWAGVSVQARCCDHPATTRGSVALAAAVPGGQSPTQEALCPRSMVAVGFGDFSFRDDGLGSPPVQQALSAFTCQGSMCTFGCAHTGCEVAALCASSLLCKAGSEAAGGNGGWVSAAGRAQEAFVFIFIPVRWPCVFGFSLLCDDDNPIRPAPPPHTLACAFGRQPRQFVLLDTRRRACIHSQLLARVKESVSVRFCVTTTDARPECLGRQRRFVRSAASERVRCGIMWYRVSTCACSTTYRAIR